MGEWWTYSLSDFLMFSPATYWRLIELYQRALWPAQVLALATGLGCLAAALRPAPSVRGAALLVLALVWLWVGWAFHAQRYATINWAAYQFAWGFALQALVLAALAWRVARLPVGARLRPRSIVVTLGWVLALAAVLLYPLAGWLAGRPLVQSDLFGVTPDPTALATLGLLPALAQGTGRIWRTGACLLPALWVAVGAATLWTMSL